MNHITAPTPLLDAILDSAEDAFLSIALDGTVQSWSRGAERLYGYSSAEMMGDTLRRLLPLYECEHLDHMLCEAQQGRLLCCDETERLHKNGPRIVLKAKRTFMRDASGKVTGILEIGQAHSAYGADTPSESQLRLLIEQMPIVMWTTDMNLQITSAWGAPTKNPLLRTEKYIGRSVCEYLKSADRHATPIAQHYEALQGTASHFEYEWKKHVMDVRVLPLKNRDGEITGCLGVAIDVTDRKRGEDEIRYQASHDALTGLANYREFMDTLNREVRRAERSHHSFTILLLDMNELKKINDRYGHLVGNRALKRLASIMKQHCRSTDLAARYGGDEFAVVLIDSDLGMAQQVAGRIENHLKNDTEDPPLRVSIGIGIYPDSGRSPHELLEAADQELYRKKKEGNAWTVALR